MMGTILRDVSALDRQRLAHLEIRPPTAIERGLAKLAGADGALVYAKDARLVRRRFPMAFALGALAFLILAIVGLAVPDDPMPWLTATIAGGALYGVALAGRASASRRARPLSSTLRSRARIMRVGSWLALVVDDLPALPAMFARSGSVSHAVPAPSRWHAARPARPISGAEIRVEQAASERARPVAARASRGRTGRRSPSAFPSRR